jgi:hypothetical protein
MVLMSALVMMGMFLVSNGTRGHSPSKMYYVLIGFSGIGVGIWFLLVALYRFIFPKARLKKIAGASGIRLGGTHRPMKFRGQRLKDLTSCRLRFGQKKHCS